MPSDLPSFRGAPFRAAGCGQAPLVLLCAMTLVVGGLAGPRALAALAERVAIAGADLDGPSWSLYFGLLGRDGSWAAAEGSRWECHVNGIAVAQAGPSPASRAGTFGVEPCPPDARLSVVIAQDLSGSVGAEGARVGRAFAAALVAALPPGAEVAVLGFGGAQSVVGEFQPAGQLPRGLLSGLPAAQVGTPLCDTIADGLELAGSRRAAGHMLVVITDGLDDASGATFDQCLVQAREARVPIAAVCTPGAPATGVRRLGRLTEASAGLLQALGPGTDLQAVAVRVVTRLRPPLVLRLRPGRDIPPGPVTVEIAQSPAGPRALLTGIAHGTAPPRRARAGASALALVALAACGAALLLGAGWLAGRWERRPGASVRPPDLAPPSPPEARATTSAAALAARSRALVADLASLQEPLRTAALDLQDELWQWQRQSVQGFGYILGVADDCAKLLERDLVAGEERRGVEAVCCPLEEALRRAGLTRIAIEPGVTPYDEELHERMEAERGAEPPYVVVKELRPGYVVPAMGRGDPGPCPVRRAWVRVASASAQEGDR